MSKWFRRIVNEKPGTGGQLMSCAACHYIAQFGYRFNSDSQTVWRRCPRCGYEWDTGKGPKAAEQEEGR